MELLKRNMLSFLERNITSFDRIVLSTKLECNVMIIATRVMSSDNKLFSEMTDYRNCFEQDLQLQPLIDIFSIA